MAKKGGDGGVIKLQCIRLKYAFWNMLWVVSIVIFNRLLCSFQLGRELQVRHTEAFVFLRAVLIPVLVWYALGTKTVLRGRQNSDVEEKLQN